MSNLPHYTNDEPTLSEFDGIRYLHFGTEWVQGAMRISKPSELVLAYTQQMMAWLLFLQPGRSDTVGILGLGAGSLLRYTLKHTTASVETVEWNPQVTAICRAYFRLPTSKRSVIIHDDAEIWVQNPDSIDRYAALMVDLYDADAQGPVRDSVEFYQDCYRTLADVGVMVVNLFGNHDSFPHNLDNIRQAFSGRVLELPEIDAGNRVVLAFKGPLLKVSTAQFLARAEEVEAQFGLPGVRWARALLAQRTPSKSVTI
ncbi:MAG: spermidine synthase [Burkholderiaceae bacterium]|nr:spermidine synthase [Burkholderiaceae bacterium]